jgi:hypothetical protein
MINNAKNNINSAIPYQADTGRFYLMKRYSAILILALVIEAGLAGEGFIEVSLPSAGAMLVNSKARKLYVGWGQAEAEAEKGLYVFDIEADGSIFGTDERIYPSSPDPIPPGPPENPLYYIRSVGSMALAPDGKRLYLGLGGGRDFKERPLVIYDLNAKGEPTGKPRSYSPCGSAMEVLGLLLPPKAHFMITHLYSSGAWSFDLDAKGEPCGESQHFDFGMQVKTSAVVNDSFTRIYLANDGTIEISSLGPNGEFLKPHTSHKIGKNNGPTPLARVGRMLYSIIDGQLWKWPLNGEGDPVGKPSPVPNTRASTLLGGSHDRLYVESREYDSSDKKAAPKPLGTRLLRYLPNDQGDPGAPEFDTGLIKQKIIARMTVDDITRTVYAATCGAW